MDEKTIKKLAKEAKQELKIDHEFTIPQYNSLLEIHQMYIDWPKPASLYSGRHLLRNLYSDADLKKAKVAIKNFKIALRDCGVVGELVVEKTLASLEHATECIEELNKEKGENGTGRYQRLMRYVPPQKPGNPGNQRLREYIIDMAGWYMFMFSLKPKKPGYGSNSIFPGLISACLTVVDDEWKDKDPPYKAIKNAIKLLDKPPLADRFREHWGFWHVYSLSPDPCFE